MALSGRPAYRSFTRWGYGLWRWKPSLAGNRTQLSLAFAFTRVESGLLGPAEGYLTDRVGTRRLVFIGLLIMGAGFLLFWSGKTIFGYSMSRS